MVSTKRAMRGGNPRFFSATRSDTGSVALLDAVANAITIASRDCRKNWRGDLRATQASASENVTNWCNASPPTTTST